MVNLANAQEMCINLQDDSLVVREYQSTVSQLLNIINELITVNDSTLLIASNDEGMLIEMTFTDKQTGWFNQTSWETHISLFLRFNADNENELIDLLVTVTGRENIVGKPRTRALSKTRAIDRLHKYRTEMVTVIHNYIEKHI